MSGTAKLADRPRGRDLLQAARGGKLDEVFVRNWNRLARNLREFLNVLDELQKLGLKVTCINQPTENTPTGKLLCHVMGAFAEFDHAQILQNTRNGFTKKGRAWWLQRRIHPIRYTGGRPGQERWQGARYARIVGLEALRASRGCKDDAYVGRSEEIRARNSSRA